jgi:hypothetical protein
VLSAIEDDQTTPGRQKLPLETAAVFYIVVENSVGNVVMRSDSRRDESRHGGFMSENLGGPLPLLRASIGKHETSQ